MLLLDMSFVKYRILNVMFCLQKNAFFAVRNIAVSKIKP